MLALEPSTEPFLCVSHNHTALVLAGSLATQLPPLTRSARLHKVFLRTPAVRQLSQLLAPCLHPRVTPLELRLAVLIHGPSGMLSSCRPCIINFQSKNVTALQRGSCAVADYLFLKGYDAWNVKKVLHSMEERFSQVVMCLDFLSVFDSDIQIV